MKQSKSETRSEPKPRGLLIIAAFKFVQAAFLVVLGFAVLRLVHKDVADEIAGWGDIFEIDPDNYYLQRLMDAMSVLSDRRITYLGLGTFLYSAILLIEGIGLALRKRWAEYLTVIITASLIPIEAFEFSKHLTVPRLAIFILNIGVVIYLVMELGRNRKSG